MSPTRRASKSTTLINLTARPQAKLEILCFPHAGASGQLFAEWCQYFPDGIQVSGVELPGHGRRLFEKAFEKPSDAIESIAEAVLQYIERPYVFFGHCLGSLLAFEVSARLQQMHRHTPLHMFASGAVAPSHRMQLPKLSTMSDEEIVKFFVKVYGAPSDILENSKLGRHFLPGLRGDALISERYNHSNVRVDHGITAMCGVDDPFCCESEVEDWRAFTNSSFYRRSYNGGHFYFTSLWEQSAADIVAECRKYL
jgi:medium-chain acyl-[acyl-carrier-protein] hydrolase